MSQDIREKVRETYANAARAAAAGCCSCGPVCTDPVTANLYDQDQLGAIPSRAAQASLGCGNPLARAALEPGQVVLDLGSGGGIDVLLSAREVGPTGQVYGLDMTDEMLELARANQREAGVDNVQFLKGHIESIPLPDESVDVILSNCVINLSGDKDAVLREAFRVLKPGGRLAVSDIVVKGEVPGEIRRNVELWAGCVAGALDEEDYAERLKSAGFAEVSLTPTRIYGEEDVRALGQGLPNLEQLLPLVAGKFRSAFIQGVKSPRPPLSSSPANP